MLVRVCDVNFFPFFFFFFFLKVYMSRLFSVLVSLTYMIVSVLPMPVHSLSFCFLCLS